MLIKSFLDYLRYERNYSEKTVLAYSEDIKQLQEFAQEEYGRFNPLEVEAELIREWIVSLMDRGYTSTSVNRKLSSLRSFYKYLLRQGEVTKDSLLPDLKEFGNFVVFANPKGLLIGPDVAEYFADKRNPLYNAELAEEEAYELFCEEGLCPFDLLKYGMEHDLLPEAQFPFENGKELLQENWDFVARWFLGEYYEGE